MGYPSSSSFTTKGIKYIGLLGGGFGDPNNGMRLLDNPVIMITDKYNFMIK